MTPRLKSLELHGYKTFASRILFEYPGVITAIVGPNGSGKSNIADAIRWVLGEQSYMLLRGRKTEDMIFAGSELRPRAGMALATITFDNSDGWLPIDYSEVAITRRAYRDGQNEYLLNGQRVRLKEISELLAQSGLAERTYTIIGQGLVDAALSLKPEERRRFFEEAAGIGLYRSRREESLTRLEATRRNLERVHDIVNELEPRLQSLEKQAKRALDFERVKADLRILLRDWYGYHWHQAIQDIAHSQEVARIQEARQQNAREKLIELETQLNEKHNQLTSARNQLNSWHVLAAEKHRDREKISRELAVIEERQRAFSSQFIALDNDRANLEEEQASRELGIQDLQAELSQLARELEEAKTQMNLARVQLVERQNSREELERNLNKSRQALLDLEMGLVQRKAKYEELFHRQKTLKTTLREQESTKVQVEEKLTLQKRIYEQTQGALKNQSQLVKDIEHQIETQRGILRELERAQKSSLELIGSTLTEKSRVMAQLDILEQADRSNIGLNQGSRTILETYRQGKIKGKYYALSSMLQVPSEYEMAISSVFGEFLDAVIFEQDSDIEEAFKLLETGDKGRSVLFPKEFKGEIPREEIINDVDCMGIVSELIVAPIEIQQLINYLFGNVICVRNRGAAKRLASKISPSSRLVTIKGEVFWGNGAVSAGHEGRSGVIARPRQKNEMEASILNFAKGIEISKNRQSELEKEINESKKILRNIEMESTQANQDLNRIRQTNQGANLELDQSNQRMEWNNRQLVDLNSQWRLADDEQKEVLLEIQNLEKEINEAKENVRKGNSLLIELPIDDLNRQVAYWDTNSAVSSRAVIESERRLEERKEAIRTAEHQHRIITERIILIQEQQRQSEIEISTFHLQENEVNGVILELARQISPNEESLETMEREYSTYQGDYLSAQQAATLADRLNTQAQLELTRNRETMDAFRRRIEDDFGLVALDYSPEVSGQTPLPFDDIVEQLPAINELPPEFEESITRQRAILRRMGSVNLEAQYEYKEVKDRYEFLKNQIDDLKRADADLRQVIVELDELMQREFLKTFEAVAVEFKKNFTRLFGGGTAQLILSDEEHPVEGGVDIEARLPGRREQGLSLLSGGERSLTAVALIFSLIKVSPTPFCVMDEVDAMLDEANVSRFRELLLELSRETQFIIITHNRNTVQSADVIYGVTMGRDSASQVISLKLDEVSEEMTR